MWPESRERGSRGWLPQEEPGPQQGAGAETSAETGRQAPLLPGPAAPASPSPLTDYIVAKAAFMMSGETVLIS